MIDEIVFGVLIIIMGVALYMLNNVDD